MKKSVVLLISLFLWFNGIAQSCLPEGIIFETQAQIDSFPVNYPGCTMIEGKVEINGSDITSLLGLQSLTRINGFVFITGNNNLTDLTGLNNLTFPGSRLAIWDNENLQSMHGLEAVDSIAGDLLIHIPTISSITMRDGSFPH